MFKKTLLSGIEQTGNKTKGAKLARANSNKNPLLWKATEAWVAHRYERETGQSVAEAGGWAQLLDWLMANLPAILAILVKLFGG
jgi:hypothetical protein